MVYVQAILIFLGAIFLFFNAPIRAYFDSAAGKRDEFFITEKSNRKSRVGKIGSCTVAHVLLLISILISTALLLLRPDFIKGIKGNLFLLVYPIVALGFCVISGGISDLFFNPKWLNSAKNRGDSAFG